MIFSLAAPGPAAPNPAAAFPAATGPAATSPAATSRAAATAELLRALGSVAASPPPYCHPVTDSLGLPAPTPAEHTGVFVLSAPPHAAIHLGEHGKLGGEGLDRVAGFWRAIGLRPPHDADHLGLLLMLYAELSGAETAARGEAARDRLRNAREALLFEHLWSWAPGYLTAVARLGVPSIAAWARLTCSALAREARRATAAPALPLALRMAPAPVDPAPVGPAGVRDQLLDALVTPVRSGVLLTREDLREAAAAVGVGYRLGERRYALRAMLDQDAGATLGWLGGHARRWAARHAAQQPVAGHDPRHWWAGRATHTSRTLLRLQMEFVAAS
ncbi:MAG: molecular chaperone TorD family protein [Micromonosporaceae bacterium]